MAGEVGADRSKIEITYIHIVHVQIIRVDASIAPLFEALQG